MNIPYFNEFELDALEAWQVGGRLLSCEPSERAAGVRLPAATLFTPNGIAYRVEKVGNGLYRYWSAAAVKPDQEEPNPWVLDDLRDRTSLSPARFIGQLSKGAWR